MLYDVVGDRYVGVDDRALTAINRWGSADPAPGEESAAAAQLGELGFLVAGDAGDAARLAEARRTAAQGVPGKAYVTLLPTLACDLACEYCVQKDHPAQGHMKPEVEAAALDFIARAVPASGAEALALYFFGGEPLLRKDLVLRAAAAAAEAMRRRGIRFEWQIVTNGVSLDVPFARAMSALGPGVVKVTLDGDRETHDRVRVYRNGRGTFDRIFQATAAVARECPGIKVQVAGNIRPGQERSCEALLDRIAREGLAGKLDQVWFHPVIERGGCRADCGASAVDTMVQLGAAARRRGIRFPDADGGVDAVSPCELHWDKAWVVDPEGRLYRCLAVVGRPDLAIGDVWNGVVREDPLVAGRPWERCESEGCPFVPVCLGGCLGGSLATGGTAAMCDREALEIRFRRAIVRRYLDEFHPDEVNEVSPNAVSAAA